MISQAIEPQLKTSVKEEAGQEVKETVDVTPEKTEAGQEVSCPFSAEPSSRVFSSLLSWQIL